MYFLAALCIIYPAQYGASLVNQRNQSYCCDRCLMLLAFCPVVLDYVSLACQSNTLSREHPLFQDSTLLKKSLNPSNLGLFIPEKRDREREVGEISSAHKLP